MFCWPFSSRVEYPNNLLIEYILFIDELNYRSVQGKLWCGLWANRQAYLYDSIDLMKICKCISRKEEEVEVEEERTTRRRKRRKVVNLWLLLVIVACKKAHIYPASQSTESFFFLSFFCSSAYASLRWFFFFFHSSSFLSPLFFSTSLLPILSSLVAIGENYTKIVKNDKLPVIFCSFFGMCKNIFLRFIKR